MTEGPVQYEPIALSPESTVVAKFIAERRSESGYQSEADLERSLIEILTAQAYEHLRIASEAELIANLRAQLEALNHISFSDTEWDRFFTERIAGERDGIEEKTYRIQEDHVGAGSSRLAEGADIAENGYNLSVSPYIERTDTRETIDIITLNADLARIVERQHELRTVVDEIVADLEGGS